MRRALSCALVVVFSLVAVAARAAEDTTARGKAVYASQRCSMCHSIEGAGNKNRPLDGVGSTLTPDQIRKWIVSPREMKSDSKMKAYPGLGAEDLDALIAYMVSLKKKE